MCAAAIGAAVQSDLTPSRLRCEYATDPIGIGESRPNLSWIVESKVRGASQSAYQIVVSSSREKVSANVGDLWDTGKVVSDETAHIQYSGAELKSRQRVWWSVRCWDSQGRVSDYAKPARWEVGLLDATDWVGTWASLPGAEGAHEPLDGLKWMWYPEGDPAKEAPENVSRYFRLVVDVPAGDTVKKSVINVVGDDEFSVSVNGKSAGSGSGWRRFEAIDLKPFLHEGQNVVGIVGRNVKGAAGVLAVGRVEFAHAETTTIRTGSSWASAQTAGDGWDTVGFDASSWKPAMEVATLGAEPWGMPNTAPPSGPAALLRKEIDVSKSVVKARVYATALGLYQIEIDGKRVGHDVFTPGWTDYRKRVQYQTYDVTDRLQQGKHAIGLVVGDGWYSGHVGWSGRCQYGPKAMALAQIEIEFADGTTQTVATDASWKAGTGAILESDLMNGEIYDATQERRGWSSPGFDDSSWVAAETKARNDLPLVAKPCASAQVVERIGTRHVSEPKPGNFVFDLGQNMVGWARLKVKGPKGATVQMRFAEMLNPDGTVYTANLRGARATDRYILRGNGEEVYEPNFTFHGFRYVEVTGYPGTPKPDAIEGVVVSSCIDQTGNFECSSPLVTQLQHNIRWGQRGNYLEVPTDCPQRDERLGWMGDAQIFARTACFNYDVAAFLSKWEQDVVDSQSPEGGFPDVAPRIVDNSDGAPAWGDAGVILPWTVFRCYGDKRVLERSYPAMVKWVEYINQVNPDHLWKHRRNNDFGDWLNIDADMPREVIGTSYFAYSTSIVRDAARVLGKTEDAAKYGALFDQIREAYNKAYVSPDGKIEGDTQTCYVLGLHFGLVDQTVGDSNPFIARLTDDIVKKRNTHLSTGFVGVGYLLPTLTAADKLDVAYRLLNNDTFPSWGYSIRQGATTIWERWDGYRTDKGFQDPGMNSFNHYSLGSVGEWLYHTVAGIDLDADPAFAGYKHIVIHPKPGGGMTWAKGSLDSIRGKISTSWKVVGDHLELDVTVPANCEARVYVPGDKVTEGGRPVGEGNGIRGAGSDANGGFVTVGGGTYHFQSQWKA